MKRKKLIVCILTLVLAFSCVSALSGCNAKPGGGKLPPTEAQKIEELMGIANATTLKSLADGGGGSLNIYENDKKTGTMSLTKIGSDYYGKATDNHGEAETSYVKNNGIFSLSTPDATKYTFGEYFPMDIEFSRQITVNGELSNHKLITDGDVQKVVADFNGLEQLGAMGYALVTYSFNAQKKLFSVDIKTFNDDAMKLEYVYEPAQFTLPDEVKNHTPTDTQKIQLYVGEARYNAIMKNIQYLSVTTNGELNYQADAENFTMALPGAPKTYSYNGNLYGLHNTDKGEVVDDVTPTPSFIKKATTAMVLMSMYSALDVGSYDENTTMNTANGFTTIRIPEDRSIKFDDKKNLVKVEIFAQGDAEMLNSTISYQNTELVIPDVVKDYANTDAGKLALSKAKVDSMIAELTSDQNLVHCQGFKITATTGADTTTMIASFADLHTEAIETATVASVTQTKYYYNGECFTIDTDNNVTPVGSDVNDFIQDIFSSLDTNKATKINETGNQIVGKNAEKDVVFALTLGNDGSILSATINTKTGVGDAATTTTTTIKITYGAQTVTIPDSIKTYSPTPAV